MGSVADPFSMVKQSDPWPFLLVGGLVVPSLAFRLVTTNGMVGGMASSHESVVAASNII